MSHRLLGSAYYHEPYIIEIPDEVFLMERAAGIAQGDIEAVGYLFRVLTLCGLGISFTGISNHGSMGEHQISHYIDCFAGDRHPGTLDAHLVLRVNERRLHKELESVGIIARFTAFRNRASELLKTDPFN